MKRTYLLSLFFVSIALSCDDDDSKGYNNKAAEVEDIAMSGSWRIAYFFDTDDDETDNFAGYTFEFNPSGTLLATKGATTHSGAWSVTDDGSNDDSNDYDDIDLNIRFSAPPDFEELSEDWEIMSITNSKIELRHVSGGNGGTDLLTLEKI
jgi:hypothetical protein